MLEMTLSLLLAAVSGMGLGYGINSLMRSARSNQRERDADDLMKDARRDADNLLKDAAIQAKAEVLKAREEFEVSIKSRREEITSLDNRIAQKEGNLERKVVMIDKKERALEQRIVEVEKQSSDALKSREEWMRLVDDEKLKLQRIAGMTEAEARQTLMTRVEAEVRNEVGGLIRRLQEEAKDTADREAQKIVAQAVQRYAASHASELMTSTVALPNDEMKGRIIGRDGRNIRAIEAATGINILVDDTPEAVVISGFDPVRREIARIAMERLIQDGRIHPARIEEVVIKTREEMDERIRLAGEEAVYQVGLHDVDPELVRTLGRLKFRTSYSQNVLMHSIEVAQLMGVMAAELGLDVTVAKRIGLLHDIGKALDHDVEGSHALIGADFLRRLGETSVVLNAVAAHHEDVPVESLYAVLAAAGDAISASRPGARIETTEIYIKRLEKLEGIANSFPGVEKSYAIQAGREMRVLVQPDKVNDHEAMTLARNICKKIEGELQYPGQIKVMVVRESRCVEYAR
ncbi:MAG: ribonuclease Y [bacterium]